MYLIGLTGGIASGKSTVSKMLVQLGARVIDADQVAREVVSPGKPAWRAIAERFGEGILLPNQTLNRKKLGEIIFSDAAEKKWLDDAMHPAIREAVEEKIREQRSVNSRFVVLDVPLLFEAGWDGYTDENWVVNVEESAQLSRLMRRNQLSEAQARDRMRAQMPPREKLKLADIVIDNTKDLEHLHRQVLREWRDLEQRVQRGAECEKTE